MARSKPPGAASNKAKPAKAPRKSPVEYTEELGERICEQIAAQTVSLEKILSQPGMPGRGAFHRWRREKPELARAYELAKQVQVERYVDETIEIADERAVTKEQVQRNKIRISARQWYAEKLVPKLYGQKIAHGGAEDLPPIKTQSEVNLTPGEAYKRIIEGG